MQIVQPMLAGFKLEIAKMRSEGVTQAEIDLMLDEFEEVYAPEDDAEGELVVAVLSKLLGSPASSHKLPITLQRKRKPRYSDEQGLLGGPSGGWANTQSTGNYATKRTDYARGVPREESEKGSVPRRDGLPPKRTYL